MSSFNTSRSVIVFLEVILMLCMHSSNKSRIALINDRILTNAYFQRILYTILEPEMLVNRNINAYINLLVKTIMK